jgi:uncharacterized protein YecE (DUF72 family)
MSEAQIRIGIGGWTYAPWRGVFYPDKLPQAKECEFAARAMTAIEINATFYGRQKPKSWESWEKVAPDGFQFAIKGSRYCVSRSKLAESADSIANFFGQGFEALGPKLGPILWQFAPYKRFDSDDIAAFIDLLPEELSGITLRHAIEPRHESFRDEKFFELCRARNVAIVFEDSDDYPQIEADTADFAYARLQRMNEEIFTGYDDSALDGFAARAKAWQAKGDAYIFMINGAKVRAPAAALALQERLR